MSNSRAIRPSKAKKNRSCIQSVGWYVSSTGSTNRRFSAERGGLIGGIMPVCIHEAPSVETEAGHLLTQRPPRGFEPLDHAADPAAGLQEAAFDKRAFEGFDLLGQGPALPILGEVARHQ